ncbi:putative beta-N-hexosaminidase [Talaromyces proteolyticus]|uniref:beta-N-acetylhexosaminidase n=1 Tax=Talaromyces proteolyticus TaxID=1131652 RepID=A0AAD4Q006_9EURO|nr:putative beta-N-hexosaminidase [Talaromyces proteolyticus]KAH8703578.1 putative beta-N-hexosaminidase [Talaromyces proteolyticus]
MRRLLVAPLFLTLATAVTWQLLPPPLTFSNESQSFIDFSSVLVEKKVYIERRFSQRRDSAGLTLIPPSAYEFAQTFIDDLEDITSTPWSLNVVEKLPKHGNGIFLGFSAQNLTYQNKVATEEGYTLDIRSDGGVVIAGTGSRGMWWGTRTLLQMLIQKESSPSNMKLPVGHFVDAPAYPTRGFMLDAGRKWYSLSFLKDLCTYASFFKMSEFHYHSADNYPLSRGHNETWYKVYSQFSMRPISDGLSGLVQRKNETLSPDDLEDFQQHCARRGVTLIPEIEAPGHALSITKWKPELALFIKDLLNLSHPDTIPTVKSIWTDFLPRLHSKEVHIGADEYDSTLADDYINFVNEMSDWIQKTSNKKIRIWGTYEPSPTNLTISKDITIQHWQAGQSDPTQLVAAGYNIINSEDKWAYMSIKNDHVPISPAPYPVFFNETKLLNYGDKQGNQWDPRDINYENLTLVLDPASKSNKGAIFAAWNDNGPDASTQLEAYYAIRRGVPLVAARAWSGSRGPLIHGDTIDQTIDFLTPRIPGENLDRVLLPSQSRGDSLFSWKRQPHHSEKYHLNKGSKGLNYTLTLSVSGPFNLSSSDVSLSLSAPISSNSSSTLVFTSDGWSYPLRSTSYNDSTYFPESPGMGRIWGTPPGNMTESSHVPVAIANPSLDHPIKITITSDAIRGSRCWVEGNFVGRFEVLVFGGHNVYESWSQMAFVAPLEMVEGGILEIDLVENIVEQAHK